MARKRQDGAGSAQATAPVVLGGEAHGRATGDSGASPAHATFFVPGVAVPGGSKKAFRHAATGKVVVLDDAKGNRAWRDRVAAFASVAMGGRGLMRGPLRVSFEFRVPRPKSHFGTGRNKWTIRPGAPDYPTVRPDALKLARAAEDAMSGVVYADDAQTVNLTVRKVYHFKPGLAVVVEQL